MSCSGIIRSLTLAYLPELEGWIDRATGTVADPFETIDAEGYAPALLALLFAKGYRWTGNEEWLAISRTLLRRSASVLTTPIKSRKAFRDLFLAYFVLRVISELRGELPATEKQSIVEALLSAAWSYQDNLNGQVLTVLFDLHAAICSIKEVFPERLAHRLQQIGEFQTPSGFFNDGLSARTYPIAYHLFIYDIIADAAAQLRESALWHVDGAWQDVDQKLHNLLQRENGWLENFIADDGSLSMTERSADHVWTCGAAVAYFVYRGRANASDWINRHIEFWNSATTSRLTTQVTPNSLSPFLRIGYEPYANAVQYGPLGLVLAALAADAKLEPMPMPQRSIEDGLFVDRETGYLHWRSNGSSLGLSLSSKKESPGGGYCLIGSLFNLCVDRLRTRVVASSVAKPLRYRLEPYRVSTSHEGLMLLDLNAQPMWPGAQEGPINVSHRDERLQLIWEQPGGQFERKLWMQRRKLSSVWTVKPKTSLGGCELTIPLLLDQGKGDRRLRIKDNRADFFCEEAGEEVFVWANAAVDLDLGISTDSPAGIVRSIRLVYPNTRIEAGDTIDLAWSVWLGRDTKKISQREINGWIISAKNSGQVRLSGNTVQARCPQGEAAYLISGREFRNFSQPPDRSPENAIAASSALALIVEVDIDRPSPAFNCELFWITYSAQGREGEPQQTFRLFSGLNIFPVSNPPPADRFRVALRLSGEGEVIIKSMKLEEMPY